MSKNKLPSRSNHAISLTSGNAISRLVFIFAQLPNLVKALPIFARNSDIEHNDIAEAMVMSPELFYTNLFTSIFLVLAGGVFAGLTLGLMGQDEVYLKVIATSGEPQERNHARKVLKLIGRGKHWVLVTLLLSNVITNETLPIVLDRCLGGGWPAVVTSTVSIVVFGEIIPQSICVRYGLQVGAMFSPFVLLLMYIMYPVAYPCALLLDHILGEDHGTVYKKSGLKTLVTLHKTMGVERLNQDEVTIISAVLDLKEKPVAHIMTPMDRVYTMSADAILDEKTVEEIFNAGFSRIPIHLPNEPMNFIGMLLVRVLISYDPEDALPVASFPLATLPETGRDTSCLNILNYFQEGKSHMIVVSENPGEPTGALGVLTLEDVIEELIGEEIVDESDVYIDINKNIKRTQPGPLSKRNLTTYLNNLYHKSASASKRNSLDDGALTPLKDSFATETSSSPSRQKLFNGSGSAGNSPMMGPIDATKGWKPLNPASNPLELNKSFVKIKRTDMESVKNSVMPPPKRLPPKNTKSYGAIHATEEGALNSAKNLNGDSEGEASNHDQTRFLLPEEKETDLSEIMSRKKHQNDDSTNSDEFRHHHHASHNGEGYDIHYHNDYSASHPQNIIPEHQEARSYRTGGIIESVVNVQGVHKTIIENVDEENDYSNLRNSLGNSLENSQVLGQLESRDIDEESESLLAGLKKKAAGSSILSGNSSHSDDSKNRKSSVWDKFMNTSNSNT
mmetsp:Transcript_733/g.814  ORF Transcript_733/g.814 Transcript_733/m.814 type:complete len:733 (-) Transcript_733:4-2202(-)